MAAREIATLSHTVLQIASIIQETGNNWYKASADWEAFPRKVRELKRRYVAFDAKLNQFGKLSDTSLKETLSDLKASLDVEEANLSSRKASGGGGLLSKVSMTLFPAKIGLSMQEAIDAFGGILRQLNEEHEVHVAVVTSVIDEPPTFSVPNDDRYVPLVKTETAVFSALEDPEVCVGPSIVLLHGLSGKGKSTLARHAVLRYQHPPNSTLFKRVVFLECGPAAEHPAKQFELLQLLGATTGASDEQEQWKSSGDMAIRKLLLHLLKDQKILIILDDIWNEEFLKYMVRLCGAQVKCLVTSQRGDLCQRLGFSVTRILIEDVDEAIAMKILASHVGFGDTQIPEQIQGSAKKLVEKTEGHPLALACIATAIDENRLDEVTEWQAASENFMKLLDSEDTAYIHGEKYPRSFWAAMKLSVNSLKKDAKDLLILVHMCAGPSIPEEVLRVLYHSSRFQCTSDSFEKIRKCLESRELIKITGLQEQRSWSVHSLQKLFVEKEMRDIKETMFILLALETSKCGVDSSECRVEPNIITEFPRAEDAMVQITICALYFDKDFSKRVGANMKTTSESLSDLRRNAIEPITRLLGWPLSEGWNSDAQSSAKQIFLTYIHKNVLHSEGVLHLLKLQISILPTLSALKNVTTIDARKGGLLDHNSRGVIKALVDLVEDNARGNDIAMAAAGAVWRVVGNDFHFEIIISSGILGGIVRILSSGSSTDLKIILLNTFCILGRAGMNIGRADEILETPGILPSLIRFIVSENDATLQLAALRPLAILAGTKVGHREIVHYSGVLQRLTNLLSNISMPLVQEEVGRILCMLCVGPEEAMLMVINSPQALEQLVKSLSLENNPTLNADAAGHSYFAAWSLKALSQGMRFMTPANKEHVKQKCSDTHGLMDGLRGLIGNGIPGSTQEVAIQALTYLDPDQGNGACLLSAKAFLGRGLANIVLELNEEALKDLDEADKIEPGNPVTLIMRSTVQARLGDFQKALAYADEAIKKDRSFINFQERGVLKRMLGDREGALADLDKGLDLYPNGYECLKHRGYVRFLMRNEEGARSDADMALSVQPAWVDYPGYGHRSWATTSVEFLGYNLR